MGHHAYSCSLLLSLIHIYAAGRAERCEEILRIASLGLKKRLEHTGAKTAVVGLSGGLDSTPVSYTHLYLESDQRSTMQGSFSRDSAWITAVRCV